MTIKELTSIPMIPFPLFDLLFFFCRLSTRHIFFTHVKEDLHNGHLRMCSDQAVELSALLAQAEFGDYNQNTAQYWYSELCGEEPSVATIDRYRTRLIKAVKTQMSRIFVKHRL